MLRIIISNFVFRFYAIINVIVCNNCRFNVRDSVFIFFFLIMYIIPPDDIRRFSFNNYSLSDRVHDLYRSFKALGIDHT